MSTALCSVDGCDKPRHSHGYCGAHAQAYRRYGNPLTKGVRGRKRKAQITHSGAHKRVMYDRGKASEYPCVDCGEQAQEWSVRHDISDACKQEGWVRSRGGTQSYIMWSTNSQDYDPRCKPCHRKYDKVWESRERDAVTGRFLS